MNTNNKYTISQKLEHHHKVMEDLIKEVKYLQSQIAYRVARIGALTTEQFDINTRIKIYEDDLTIMRNCDTTDFSINGYAEKIAFLERQLKMLKAA